MALERQTAINSDPQEVAEFWEVFDYLQSLSDDPVVNHSKKDDVIAINLDQKAEAEYLHKLAGELDLSPDQVNAIHDKAGAPRLYR